MEDLNDPKNIIGMANILADDIEELDTDEIEKSIVEGITFKSKNDTSLNIADEYTRELDQLSRQFHINETDDVSVYPTTYQTRSTVHKPIQQSKTWSPTAVEKKASPLSSKFIQPNYGYNNSVMHTDEPDDDGDLDNDTNNFSSNFGNNFNNDVNDNTNNNDANANKARSNLIFGTNDHQNNRLSNIHSSWDVNKPTDNYLMRMTNEERKQQHINKVLGTMDKIGNDEASFLHQDEEEDEMARILEQIDLLKTNLETEGVDLARIPEVNSTTNKKEARAVLRILQIKNDRLRYCDMFNEGILAMAYGLESAFDGKKQWFGTQIDLTGWSDTVKVKLRRMRYDTSTFVGDVMRGYNLGAGWRLLFELLPSLFLYSRDRRLRSNDTLISDDRYRDAINKIM